MYIVRDIFQLKFGHYRDAKALMDEPPEWQEGYKKFIEHVENGHREILKVVG